MEFWKNDEFLSRLNNGDKKAYLEVYDFFAPKIFRFIYYKAGKNKEMAEEIAQQTFFKTWEYISKNKKNIDNIQAFLYRIAHNLMVDSWKKASNDDLPIMEDMIETTEELKNNIEIDHKIDIAILKKTMEGIPRQYKDIIMMRFMEDLTIDEIASILNKEKNSVYVQVHRAITALKKKYEKTH